MTSAVEQNTCPSCGTAFVQGADQCENCFLDLTRLSLPATWQPKVETDFGEPLTTVRLASAHVLPSDAPVSRALGVLRADPAGAVVVAGPAGIVGICTERDVLKKVAGRGRVLDAPLETIMTPDPVILRDTDTVATALNKMAVGGFRHIPLVHGSELLGVVTASELMQWFMQKYFD
jgi:CBS domain-containing protein